jgi:RNA polymerase sigma-70 factor (ECF subfamily)
MLADVDLVAGIRAGETAALEALYEKYKTQIFRTAFAITGDRHTAEEVLQDTFVQAFVHADSIDGSLPLAPWLHRVALNLSANRRARKQLLSVPLDSLAERIFSGDDQSPERLAERNELRRAVQQAVSELDFKHRAVIVLFYLQDFSLKEIAYILDCPVGTVKSRLHYACQILKHRLAPERGAGSEAAKSLPVVS